MFTSKKNKNDVAGSTQRFIDLRRDATSRFKHLRFVVESTPDAVDRKNFVELYCFETFHLFHEFVCQVDAVSSHGAGPRNVTELEYALWILELLLTNLPELIAQRWQFNAIYATLKRISHPSNTLGLRRIATRLFIIWYQILGVGSRGADDLDIFFAVLVPNLPREKGTFSDATLLELCECTTPNCAKSAAAVDSSFTARRSTPLAPAAIAEKGGGNVSKGLLTQAYMDKLLEAISTEATKIIWRVSRGERTKQCLRFLLEKIKQYYAPLTIGASLPLVDVNSPKVAADGDVVRLRGGNAINLPVDEDPCVVCTQCLSRWVAMYSFSHRKQSDSLNQGADQSFGKFLQQQSPTSRTPETKLPPNYELIRELFFSSRETTNFAFTILREGFLLPLSYAGTMGRVFKVLREWLTMDDADVLPPFFDEPRDGKVLSSPAVGLQKSLRSIVAVLSSFFVNPYLVDEKERVSLILQISSRILTLLKHLANNNNVELTLESWTFVLRVLLQVVRSSLPRTPPVAGDYPLAHRLAPQLYQTLLVTWVFAGLHVVLPCDLWEELLATMTERTCWPSLINEWAKVMESVTRALGSQVYNVDLFDLPLERLSEQKSKKIRGQMGESQNSATLLVAAEVKESPNSNAYNFMPNISPNIPTNNGTAPIRPNRKNVTPPDVKRSSPVMSNSSNSKHQALARSMQKSVDVASESGGDALPSELNSLDGSDGAANVNCDNRSAEVGGEVDVEMKSPILDGDIFASSPLGGDEDVDSMSEDFAQIEVNSDSPSNLQFNSGSGDDRVFGAPETIAIMWRRMLSCLGDLNEVQDPDVHFSGLEVVSRIVDMLLKIRNNQSVLVDGSSQIVYPPALVPPYLIFVPWVLKSLELSERYHKSKLVAMNLLCRLIVRRQDIAVTENIKAKFYLMVRSTLTNGDDDELTLTLLRSCGAKIFYLPSVECAEFLLSDYVRVSAMLLAGKLSTNNRQLLIHFLSCIVNLPSSLNVNKFYTVADDVSVLSARELQAMIVDCLNKTVTSVENFPVLIVVQALKGIAVFVYSTLIRGVSTLDDVGECVNVLLACLAHGSLDVGHAVCQLLTCLLDVLPAVTADELRGVLHLKVVESLNSLLNTYLRSSVGLPSSGSASVYSPQTYIMRLLFDLADWCLRLPRKLVIRNNLVDKNGVEAASAVGFVLDDVSQTFISVLHNEKVPFNCKLVAQSLISMMVRFYDQLVQRPCCANEWDDESSGDLRLYLKFRKNCILSLEPSDEQGSAFRLFVRQTAGKDCLDAVHLKNERNQRCVEVNKWLLSKVGGGKEMFMQKVESPSKKSVVSTSSLSSVSNGESLDSFPSEKDADSKSLERLLAFLEKTSPECFPSFHSSTPNVNDGRVEQIAGAVDQLKLNSKEFGRDELELVDVSMTGNTKLGACHLFMDANLCPVWEKRNSFNLLEKSERAHRELKHVDSVLMREVHKIAVVYVAEGQEDKQSILKNSAGSKNFESFVAALGYEVDLKRHSGYYAGGLPAEGTAVYWSTPFVEVVYHVSTRNIGSDAGDWTKKLRHIGNDEVHIVWSEHWRDYRRNVIPTDFCDVLIVIYPIGEHLFRVQIEKNADVPDFGPLFDGALVEWAALAPLVRCTAVNASRAKRASMNGYKNCLEHRYESLVNSANKLTTQMSYNNLVKTLWMVGGGGEKK